MKPENIDNSNLRFVSTDRGLHSPENIKLIDHSNIDSIIDSVIEQNFEAIKDLVDL